MAWKDEWNNAQKILKSGDPKKTVEFFWGYYKWHLVAILLATMTFGSLLHTSLTAKECVLSGVILNTTGSDDAGAELEQGFLTSFPIDGKKQEICFDTSYYYSPDMTDAQTAYQTLQMIAARTMAGDIDFIIGDFESVYNLAYKQSYYELSEVLSEEQMEYYEPYFLYYDRAFADQLRNMDTVPTGSEPIVYPDPKKPELMEDPVPILIAISGCSELQGVYLDSSGEYAMAFALNGTHSENAVAFLEYLIKQDEEQ